MSSSYPPYHEMAEEDIDAEALQAQIDLSMSVTNDLVSSWLKPSNKPSQKKQNLELELKEYMRRPPRLGVGASIPESASVASRETARLKGQLTGKGNKRPREDEGASSTKQLSDDEGESRTSAIRKKPMPNPFAMPSQKKKPVQLPDTTSDVDRPLPAFSATVDDPNIKNTQPADTAKDSIPDIPRKKKRKKVHHRDSSGLSGSVNTVQAGDDDLPIEQNLTDAAVNASSSTTNVAETLGVSDTPMSTTQLKLRQQPSSNDLVHSVLNLDGPVGEGVSDPEEPGGSPSKTKKKRKRRKKKKHSQTVGMDGPSKEAPKEIS